MEVYAKSDIGSKRESNQDRFYVDEDELQYKLFILADGMGGYAGGEIASSLAVEKTKEYITNSFKRVEISYETISAILKEAIEYANMIVNEKAKQEEKLSEMGTTLDVVIIYKDRIFIGHVGDSRVYRIRKNIIRKLTTDHSYVEKLLEIGDITKEEAKNHPQKNMLVKAIGAEQFVEPDIIQKKVLKDDIVLMCSDGLTNMVTENEIYQIVKSVENNIADKLIFKANEKGGNDNITAIIIKI